MADQNGPDKLGRARDALAAAVADARARGVRPAQPPGRARSGPEVGGPERSGARSASAAGQPRDDQGPAGASKRDVRRRRRLARQPGFPAVPRDGDPEPLSAAIDGLLREEGWALAAATGSVFGRWAAIVGPDLAAHTSPESLTDGELAVSADSTAWATQLRLLAPHLVRRLNAELGAGTVTKVKVRGPVTNPRKPGEWRVRGSRGPGDTYG